MEEGRTFGGRVRQRRQALGLTQMALAVRCGTAIRTVLAWENGQRDPRRLADLERLARELGVTPGWLAFGGDEEGSAA